MTRLVFLIILLTAAAAATQAQAPVERVPGRVVIDVVAVDRNGAPLMDLKRDEVEVWIRGAKELVGTWQLVSIQLELPDKKIDLFGPGAKGQQTFLTMCAPCHLPQGGRHVLEGIHELCVRLCVIVARVQDSRRNISHHGLLLRDRHFFHDGEHLRQLFSTNRVLEKLQMSLPL